MAVPCALEPAALATAADYERHRPEQTVLYTTLQAHWKTFVSELEAAAESPVLPAFVISEVEAFLRCGILAHGLIAADLAGRRRSGGLVLAAAVVLALALVASIDVAYTIETR